MAKIDTDLKSEWKSTAGEYIPTLKWATPFIVDKELYEKRESLEKCLYATIALLIGTGIYLCIEFAYPSRPYFDDATLYTNVFRVVRVGAAGMAVITTIVYLNIKFQQWLSKCDKNGIRFFAGEAKVVAINGDLFLWFNGGNVVSEPIKIPYSRIEGFRVSDHNRQYVTAAFDHKNLRPEAVIEAIVAGAGSLSIVRSGIAPMGDIEALAEQMNAKFLAPRSTILAAHAEAAEIEERKQQRATAGPYKPPPL